MAKRHLILVAPVGDPADGAWPTKFEQTVVKGPYRLEYWGWKRYSGESDSRGEPAYDRRTVEESPTTQAGTPRTLLLKGGGRGSWRARLGYPLWIGRVFRASFGARDAVLVCVTLDCGLACALASLFRPIRFVFANLDNMSKSFRWPRPVRWMLERLEHFTVRRCCMHILPSPSRWGRVTAKECFLPNAPTTGILQSAQKIADTRNYQRGPILTVYFNGLLGATRGCGTLLRAVRALPPDMLRVIVAGKCKCREIEELVRLPNVTDLGMLPMDEALALNYSAHFAFTFYDPVVELNRIAEPNKWEDCIATRTPFIVNSEVVTAARFMERDACVHVPYDDWQGLADVLKHMAETPDEWTRIQQNLSGFATSPWDIGLLRLLEQLPWNEFCERSRNAPLEEN